MMKHLVLRFLLSLVLYMGVVLALNVLTHHGHPMLVVVLVSSLFGAFWGRLALQWGQWKKRE